MAATPAKKSNLFQFALLFVIAYVLSQIFLRVFYPSTDQQQERPITLAPVAEEVRGWNSPELTLANTTNRDLILPDRCPMPPVEVYRVVNDQPTPLTATGTAVPCESLVRVPAGQTVTIDLGPWKYSLFNEYGIYEVRLPSAAALAPAAASGALSSSSLAASVAAASQGTSLAPSIDQGAAISARAATGAVSVTSTPATPATSLGSGSVLTTRFEIYEAGPIVKIFRTLITRPFLNFLVFVASLLPDHNLGIAIIVLTLLVKLLLYFPTQHSLEGQRKMQAVQPKVEELRKKHKDDPRTLQQETMKIWKEHKINPFSSCLPLLIQFPVLIGLFYVVRDGSALELSRELLYPFFRDIQWSFGTSFLGLDLTVPSMIMPPLLVGLQFYQMKLAFQKRKKQQSATIIDAATGKPEKKPASAEDMQQKVMLYGLPLMIGFFSLQFPMAVSLYWGVSTLFAIGQQLVVNRKVG